MIRVNAFTTKGIGIITAFNDNGIYKVMLNNGELEELTSKDILHIEGEDGELEVCEADDYQYSYGDILIVKGTRQPVLVTYILFYDGEFQYYCELLDGNYIGTHTFVVHPQGDLDFDNEDDCRYPNQGTLLESCAMWSKAIERCGYIN